MSTFAESFQASLHHLLQIHAHGSGLCCYGKLHIARSWYVHVVTYNLSGANTATANTATLTMGASNGTFAIPAAALPSIGATTVTISAIATRGRM
jgi:hypothetical protein